jgi:hypothetical protein
MALQENRRIATVSASIAPLKSRWGTIRFVVLAALLWTAAGCGARQTVEGKVTVDDRPLEQGYINFRPLSGAKGPPVGGPIEQGAYAIQLKTGLEGRFRVEITSMGKTGKTYIDESGAKVDVEGQVLPDRYNAQSTLEAELKPRQRNEFSFPLKSK